MEKIIIGIQARLSSSRFPNKALVNIDDKRSFEMLLDSVGSTCDWVERKKDYHLKTFLLVPLEEKAEWEILVHDYNIKNNRDVGLHVGALNNVFSRYDDLFMHETPDYIVRLTADCPFLPAPLLSKMLTLSVKNKIDYFTNTFEKYRTMPDGYDVEILSYDCFRFLQKGIAREGTAYDMEHVTTYLKQNIQKASHLRIALISSAFDMSDYKYSLDTENDLEELRKRHENKIVKDSLACKKGFKIYVY